MNVLLVISGNQAIRESLRNALPKSDLLIFETAAESACRRLVSLHVDSIVLDDGPNLGGAVLASLKAAAPNTPVLALSSRSDTVTQAGLTRSGADHVLVKPFSCDSLRQALETIHSRGNPGAQRPPFVPVSSTAPSPALAQHQMALRWLSRVSAHADDPVRLGQSLIESAMDIFDAVRCALLLEKEDGIQVIASHGIPESIVGPLRLGYGSGLMRHFDQRACLVEQENILDAPDVLKEMQLLHALVAAPLLRGGRVFGAITLGEKASGVEYSTEERELLTLVARSTSMAFDRAGVNARGAEQRLAIENIFAHLQAGLVTVGPDKRIVMMNREAETLLDVHATDMSGRSVQKLGSAFADVALRTLAEMTPRRQKVRDAATGAWLDLQASPVTGGGAVLLFSKTVEERAAAEDIAYSPFWEYLASRVAQEIKNPMVAINTFAQLLPRKYDSEDFREAFSNVVQKEVARINGVVETLFEFANNPKVALERCHVNDTLRNILRSFEEELAAHAITLETDLDPELAEAPLDPKYFTQAVRSVLNNSVEAMPGGGRLTISTKKDGNQAEIRIRDTGKGMKQEDESGVFLPFYSTKERGMGLGLPMARRILQEHQGELKLAANDDGGAAFTLRFPAGDKGEKTRADDSGD